MRCPVCVEKDQESTLHPGMSSTTCMAGSLGHYDKAGDWVEGYDPNVTTTPYRCSNGHSFVEESRGGKVIGTTITNREDAKTPSDRPGEATFSITGNGSRTFTLYAPNVTNGEVADG
jgi:hypothetical protein